MTGKTGAVKGLSSRIENMRDLEPDARRELVGKAADLDPAACEALAGSDALPLPIANGMIENVIGKFELPLGVATNFTVNGRDYLVPMAVEEPSVVAAASYMARIARENGGFFTDSTEPLMRAQIQVLGLSDPDGARQRLLADRTALIEMANAVDPLLVDLGGGCRDVEVHIFRDTPVGTMIVMHLIVDVRDAMGANTVNTMAERLAPKSNASPGAGYACGYCRTSPICGSPGRAWNWTRRRSIPRNSTERRWRAA